MTHLWVRAEQRPNEERVGLTPEGAAALLTKGFRVSVEESPVRAHPDRRLRGGGLRDRARPIPGPRRPRDAIIFGLKELPDDDTPLIHSHIMFGHAFKGQHAGRRLLARFKAGGGTLYDLEYLVDETDRRVAAFGYWAGFAGAALSLMSWIAQKQGHIIGPVATYPSAAAMKADIAAAPRRRPPHRAHHRRARPGGHRGGRFL